MGSEKVGKKRDVRLESLKGVSLGADHASESLQSHSGLYPSKLTVSLTGSLLAFLRSRLASPPIEVQFLT